MKNLNSLVFASLLFIISGCTNDDSLKDDLIGSGQIGAVDPGLVSCAAADFGNWQESEYNLPYHVGEVRQIGLSSCSGSYHGQGLPDQFAVDFNMEVGEPVLAARSGTVVYVEESGTDGNFPNNLIVVRHSDGTFGQYMHLTFDGAVVEVSQGVAQGQLIGYSGNTGLAGYPHLHFVVTTPLRWTWPYFSIPITFKNTIENERGLLEGEFYPALPEE